MSTDTTDNPPRRPIAAIVSVILGVLLLGAVGGVAYLGQLYSEEKTLNFQLDASVKATKLELDKANEAKRETESQLIDKQAEVERLKTEWTQQVDQLKKDHQDKVERIYAQMNEIVYDSKKTLEYIGSVEDKLKSGQALDKEEAKKLEAVTNGLAMLHSQYKKPINEFRELDNYLTDQLNLPAATAPKQKHAFLRRIFSKDYRAQEAEYFKDQGQREAFERARTKVADAYARAQSQMQSLELDSDKYLAELEAVSSTNKASDQEVTDFFEKSKEILKIHDRIMNIEPESGLNPIRP